jgi:hypothetical protein
MRGRTAAAAFAATAVASIVLGACSSGTPGGEQTVPTIHVGPTTTVRAGAVPIVQQALLTAAAAMNKYYFDDGQSFSGIMPAAFLGMGAAGDGAVTAASPSTGPKVISLSGSDQKAAIVAFDPETHACWGILMTSSGVEGEPADNTYVETPAVAQSRCRASNYTPAPPHGTSVSLSGFAGLG